MKFKHTFHVFVNNFSATYKLLLYRIIVSLVFAGIYVGVTYPFIARIMDAAEYKSLMDAIQAVTSSLARLELVELEDTLPALRVAVSAFLEFLSTKTLELALAVIIILVVYCIQKFLHGLGNYTTGALINDKMALQADSSFIGTLIKNLGKASLYNVIYVPLSLAYDVVCVWLVYALFFRALSGIPLLFKVFLFVTVIIALIAIKMTITTDWLPSLIHGKKNNRKAIAYTFSRKGKKTANVFSNFLVIILLILAANVGAIFLTFGAALLLTVPASYVLLISFEFVNYCDTNDLSYFTDRNSIVKPAKEKTLTREEFFKGEQD